MVKVIRNLWIFAAFSLVFLYGLNNVFAGVAEISRSLDPMTLRYLSMTIEPDETSAIIEIVSGSGDIDLYVRKDEPATGQTSSEISYNSDFASESPSWDERIVIDQTTNPRLTPGTWYLTLVNLNEYPVIVRVRVTTQTATATSTTTTTTSTTSTTTSTTTSSSQTGGENPAFMPETGLWYNKDMPGHGIDIERSGANLAAVWYTYNTDGTPTWYLALAPYSGQRIWSATLNRYRWTGSSATASPVGNITLEFKNPTKATFRWTLNGQSGSEPINRFFMDDGVPQTNLTGLWYNSSEPGYGYSIDTQGDTVAIVAYFYDGQGEPRWALNSSAGQNVFAQATVPATVFFGPCPGCQNTGFRSQPAGTISRNFTDTTHGTISTEIALPSPMNSSWSRQNVSVTMLSNPVDNKKLELQIVMDKVLELFSGSTDLVGGFSDSFSSLSLSNIESSTCPHIDLGNVDDLDFSKPMFFPIHVDFGSGCTDKKGNTWSGFLDLPLNVIYGSTLHLDGQLSIHDIVKNGHLLSSGDAGFVFDFSENSNTDLVSGTGNIQLNLKDSSSQPLTGQVALDFRDVDFAPIMSLASGSSQTASINAILEFIGANGMVNINLTNVTSGSDTYNGSISIQGQTKDVGQVSLNLQSNDGPITGRFTIRRGSSDSDFFVSTVSPANISGYEVTIDNLEINPDVCEDGPIAGNVVITKDGNSGRFTFNQSCLGYVFTGL